jgi:hypothetical protein
MVSEKQLRETVEKKFRQIWEQKSLLAKRAKPLEPGQKIRTRKFGVRFQLPKTVTDQTIEEVVNLFLKKEQQWGFIEANKGDFFIGRYPTVDVMLETFDSKGNPRLLFETPIITVYAEAGFLPTK